MKKKASRTKPETPETDGTVAFQVRLDADLHARLKAEAEFAGISMNQLIQGTLRGALDHLVQGEAEIDRSKCVNVKAQKGCLFYGRKALIGASPDDPHGPENLIADHGTVWFGLDFTNRGVVRYQP